jgi:hypothetical protein
LASPANQNELQPAREYARAGGTRDKVSHFDLVKVFKFFRCIKSSPARSNEKWPDGTASSDQVDGMSSWSAKIMGARAAHSGALAVSAATLGCPVYQSSEQGGSGLGNAALRSEVVARMTARKRGGRVKRTTASFCESEGDQIQGQSVDKG